MKCLFLILFLSSFSLKAQNWNLTPEQDLTFDYYSGLLATIGISQTLDRITHHKHPLMCRAIATGLNTGVVFFRTWQRWQAC